MKDRISWYKCSYHTCVYYLLAYDEIYMFKRMCDEMRWIVSLLVNSVVLIAVSGLLKGIAPDAFYVANIQTAIIASIILAVLNVFVKPFLILITLPITVVTFGFFLIVINAITLKIADSLLGDAFNISGFGVAIVAAICISIFNMIIEKAIVEPLYEKKRK
ncbi:putative membrane protein YvlD [Bacillus thuringiensis]|nr:putative membrane protein YvlD [Bacillus thuringiensis]OFC73652.1 putative membrane protein YvlD [Bacillus thuringiensis]